MKYLTAGTFAVVAVALSFSAGAAIFAPSSPVIAGHSDRMITQVHRMHSMGDHGDHHWNRGRHHDEEMNGRHHHHHMHDHGDGR
jgi:hypothetical protein